MAKTRRDRALLTLSLLLMAGALLASGCGRDTSTLAPATAESTDPVVFSDGFGAGVGYQAFAGSKTDAVMMDDTVAFLGTSSLKITVPDPGGVGTYAGGAFTTNQLRDLSGYDCLTFWAKADRNATLDVAGLGNDNTGASRYTAQRSNLALTTDWQRYIVPIPLPEKLSIEGGLFFFAEGPEDNQGYTIWMDEIVFASLGTIGNPRPVMDTRLLDTFVGAVVEATGCRTTFSVDGVDRIVQHMPGYFTFSSDADSVATVRNGEIRAVGGGQAVVTATLGEVPVLGQIRLTVTAPPAQPAPTPTLPAGDVISLFSNAYPDVPVTTWSAPWDQATVGDLQIAGDDVKVYTALSFAGIEFTDPTIDATGMTHFHLDLWVDDGTYFKVKLVDFGADGAFGGGDDVEHELGFVASTDPPLLFGTWTSLDLPLSRFTNLTTRGHLAQLVLSGDVGTVYVDNIYFHR